MQVKCHHITPQNCIPHKNFLTSNILFPSIQYCLTVAFDKNYTFLLVQWIRHTIITPFNTKIGLNFISTFSSYRAESTSKHRHSIQKSKTHLSRCKLWLTTTNSTCKWGLIVLCLHLLTHRTKPVQRIIQLYTHLICNSILNHRNSIYRICPTMRTNIFLRGYRNYKLPISNSICRTRNCSMSMRRVLQ
jgi:hypothetical protein